MKHLNLNLKKLTAVLTALLLVCTMACAEMAGTDHTAMITLDANPSTGYNWTAFILGGDSVTIDSAEGTYVQDKQEGDTPMVGVGGKTTFVLTAVQPGETIIRLTYSCGWEEEPAQEMLILAVVEDDLIIYTLDVTEEGMLSGTVTAVDADAYTVTLNTERLGEVVAVFDGDMALPVQGEQIVLYTDGTMTMSLPPIVNVMAWEAVPDADARAK